MIYIVRNYPAEGQSYDPKTATFSTIDDARVAVTNRLGDHDPWRKWHGGPEMLYDETAVEAYHESRKAGCGGVEITRR